MSNTTNQKFCHNCGAKTLSTFCGQCGTDLRSLNNKPPGQQSQAKKHNPGQFAPIVASDDDDMDIDHIDHLDIRMSELDVEISQDSSKENLKSVMSQGAMGFVGDASPRGAPPLTSKAEFLEQLKKEGGGYQAKSVEVN